MGETITKSIFMTTIDSNGNNIVIKYNVAKRALSESYLLIFVGIKSNLDESNLDHDSKVVIPKLIIPHRAMTEDGEEITITAIVGDVFRVNRVNCYKQPHSFDDLKINDCTIVGSYLTPIRTLEIESGITSIQGGAFQNVSVRSVLWPDTSKLIPLYAFAWCKDLQEIKGIECVTNIGIYAFENTGFKSFNWPAYANTIPEGCFLMAHSLKLINFAGPVNMIEQNAIRKTKVSALNFEGIPILHIKVSKKNDNFTVNIPVYAVCTRN